MRKNNIITKSKRQLIAFLILCCGLFANTAMGQAAVASQDTFVWTGLTSSAWEEPTNWSINRATTATGGTDTFPGQAGDAIPDLVFVNKNDTPFAPILSGQTRTVFRVTVNNNFGTTAGATLTINSDATLNITSTAVSNLVLNGGNVVNNGAIVISTTAPGSTGFPVYGIVCGNPSQLPTSPTEYGLSGNGTLSISLTNANLANSAAIVVTGNTSVNPTYKLVLNNPSISYNQASVATINAIRANGGATANKLIIAGTGFTVGTVGSPSIGSLISMGGGASVTVDKGTTLTFNSAIGNINAGITGFSSSAVATTFTNKGTINFQGASARSGMAFSTGASATASVFDINNEGTLNVNLNAVTGATGAFFIGNGGGGAVNAGSVVNLNNSGIMTLKNTATAVGTGFAIFCVSASEAAPLVITNNGSLNFEGTTYNFGLKTTINNNGTLNSNSEFRSFVAVNNNLGGSFNFVRTAATATTRQVTFTITTATDISGAIGSIYKDDNNNQYAIVIQKFASGTNLVTNVLSGATVPTSGTLTRVSGAGTVSIAYTAVSIPALNGALPVTTTNAGTINTDTASNLNIISGVSTTSTSVIAPGGSTGKGIADFAKATATLTGKTILQIAGDATAGVDYDQITNSAVAGSLSIAGTLDVTGIYTPAGTATIDIVTTEATGTLTGTFGTVIGITTGWTVDYNTPGKVQLIYSATLPTATTWTGGTSTGWINAANWSNGVPDQNSDVTIGTGTFQPSPFVNVTIKSLTINTDASLTINPTFNLTVKEAITNNGTLTISNNANLIQADNVTNTGSGNTIVRRNSNALSRLDYTIWSSPVAGQNLLSFSPVTELNRFYNYDQTINLYDAVPSPASTSFAVAQGYLIRMPNTAVTAPETQTFTGVFTGTSNNGTINKAMTYSGALFGYNMVGNPYPSTIDAQTFIAANSANIESSLYFWRKVNGASGSAYAVYNPLGGTNASPSSELPNGTIQVGQGFFVKAKSASNLTFTNAMRVANNDNKFFKTKQVQKDRLWLNLTTTSGVFSQALIGYTADATSGVDMYDAKYINDSPIALTSNINDAEYTIQGRPTFDATDVVALNFKTNAAGDFTIALDQFDGVFATGQDVYLSDSKIGAETNLKSGSYTFNADAGTDNTRFSLKYQKTLKVDAPAFDDNSISVYASNGTIYVNSKSVAISNIKVFDVQGRLLAEQNNVKTTTAMITNLRASNQVLIVKIAGEDNSEVTKKLLN